MIPLTFFCLFLHWAIPVLVRTWGGDDMVCPGVKNACPGGQQCLKCPSRGSQRYLNMSVQGVNKYNVQRVKCNVQGIKCNVQGVKCNIQGVKCYEEGVLTIWFVQGVAWSVLGSAPFVRGKIN